MTSPLLAVTRSGDVTIRRALVIAPRFMNYYRPIIEELSRRGAEVDFIADRPFDSPLMTGVTRLATPLVTLAAERLYGRQLDQFGATNYDLVLVVNGQTLSPRLLRQLRGTYPTARFVLYMWDSLRNRRSVKENLEYFDACFTFDPIDASSFGLQLRPLFFTRGFECGPQESAQYDISFVGTAHTDRYSVVRSVNDRLPPGTKTKWYLYLQAPWVYWLYRATKPHFRSARFEEFSFAQLSHAAVQEIFFSSRAILDIEHPRQTGLTMRTIEAIGASKKLVTTNARVRDYDFFDPRNIAVVDRSNTLIPASFFAEPYVNPAPSVYERYRISGWLTEIAGGPGQST